METHKNNPVTKEFTLPSLKEMLNNTPLGKNHGSSSSPTSSSTINNNNSQKSVSLKTTTVAGTERFSLPPVSSVNMQNEDSYQYVSPNSAYVMHSTLNSRPNHIPQNLYPPKPLPNTFNNNNNSNPQPLMNNTYIVYNDNMNMGYRLTRSPVNLAPQQQQHPPHHHHHQQQQLSVGGHYEPEFHVPPVMSSIPLASKPNHFNSSHPNNNNNNNQGMYTVVPQLVQNVVPMPIPQTYVQQSNIPPYHLSPQNQVFLTSVNHQPFINKNSLVPSSANVYQPSSSSLQENKNNIFQKEQQYLPQHTSSSSMGNNNTLTAPLFPPPQCVSPVYRNKINPQYSVPSNNDNSNNTPRQEVDRNTLHYNFNNTNPIHKPISPLHYKEKTGGKTKKVNRFPCAICSKPFNRFDALKTHMNMHLGLKPFNCKVCGKSFNAKQNMLRHERNHSNKY
ncbi:hypothetical protein ACO0SA_003588 [Hanseniaspora valbyensis]